VGMGSPAEPPILRHGPRHARQHAARFPATAELAPAHKALIAGWWSGARHGAVGRFSG
jgi:hypothetical protein